MISALEYGLAAAAIIAILTFIACIQDADHVGIFGCCLTVLILLASVIYLLYFVIRLIFSLF